MQINNNNSAAPSMEDIKELYIEYAQKYNRVFVDSFGDAGVFIYRTLGRKDYRDVVEDESMSSCDKEEVICEICTLYPPNYDFSNCEMGGLPTMLSNRIVELSLLSDIKSQVSAIHYYREQIQTDLDSQINCVIHEAFPEYTIDEISNWDADMSAKYMAQAEFILHNLRGVPLSPVGINDPNALSDENIAAAQNQNRTVADEKAMEKFVPISGTGKHEKLTPEKLAELERKFPQINWRADNVMLEGLNAFKGKDVDTRAIALQERYADKKQYIPKPALEYLREKIKKEDNE